jgi:hypothetical protein
MNNRGGLGDFIRALLQALRDLFSGKKRPPPPPPEGGGEGKPGDDDDDSGGGGGGGDPFTKKKPDEPKCRKNKKPDDVCRSDEPVDDDYPEFDWLKEPKKPPVNPPDEPNPNADGFEPPKFGDPGYKPPGSMGGPPDDQL